MQAKDFEGRVEVENYDPQARREAEDKKEEDKRKQAERRARKRNEKEK